jgi:hypothetical protein
MHYMPHQSHSSGFYHPNNIGWGVQIIKLLIHYMKIKLNIKYWFRAAFQLVTWYSA